MTNTTESGGWIEDTPLVGNTYTRYVSEDEDLNKPEYNRDVPEPEES